MKRQRIVLMSMDIERVGEATKIINHVSVDGYDYILTSYVFTSDGSTYVQRPADAGPIDQVYATFQPKG